MDGREKKFMVSENMPGKWHLYEFVDLPNFDHWDKGITANQIYAQKKAEIENKQKIYKWVSISCLIAGICFMAFGGLLLLIASFMFRKKGGLSQKLTVELNAAHNDLMLTWYEHTDMFIQPLAKKLMVDQWKSYRIGRRCLIYGNQGCVYFDVDKELLVAYHKDNIKEVSRERVHTGAQTSSTSNSVGLATAVGKSGLSVGGAQTATQANTTDYYEWHFDILTDFISYPKISLILSDSKSVEDFIGQAYAILKP